MEKMQGMKRYEKKRKIVGMGIGERKMTNKEAMEEWDKFMMETIRKKDKIIADAKEKGIWHPGLDGDSELFAGIKKEREDKLIELQTKLTESIKFSIIKTIHESMDYDKFDNSTIEAEALDIPEKAWNKIVISMVNDGYLAGVEINDDKAVFKYPRITIKALEYLEDYKEV